MKRKYLSIVVHNGRHKIIISDYPKGSVSYNVFGDEYEGYKMILSDFKDLRKVLRWVTVPGKSIDLCDIDLNHLLNIKNLLIKEDFNHGWYHAINWEIAYREDISIKEKVDKLRNEARILEEKIADSNKKIKELTNMVRSFEQMLSQI